MLTVSRPHRLLPLAAALALGLAPAAAASDRDLRFFEHVAGEWSGPGEIIAGKYKGTRFVCTFAGSRPNGKVGMSLDGGCRVGVFSQEMSARIEHAAGSYRGTFMDGAAGKGLDVVSGMVRGDHAIFAIHRNELTGAMRAQLSDRDTMEITISVHVADELVPVIGLQLKRLDSQTVGAVPAN